MSDHERRLRRQWRFDWRLLVFSGVFLPLLVGLGIWQLQRAEEKQMQLDQWRQQSDNLTWLEHLERGLLSGQPVTLHGHYGEIHWLLDNRTREGVPGYEVLSLFYPQRGKPVVVNRGWIQAPRRRDQLPVFPTPSGVVQLEGRISEFPQPPVLADEHEPEGGQWPRRVQSLSHQEARAQERDVAGLLVRLSDTGQPGAFRADWEPDMMGPQTHYGYAVQWFSLAVALVILTVVASYRKTGANNDNDNG